jgi:hypothetical protein
MQLFLTSFFIANFILKKTFACCCFHPIILVTSLLKIASSHILSVNGFITVFDSSVLGNKSFNCLISDIQLRFLATMEAGSCDHG